MGYATQTASKQSQYKTRIRYHCFPNGAIEVKRLALLFFLLASPALAQVVEVKAGDSSLLNSTGGGLTAYFPNSTVDVGAGISGGHFVWGASDRLDWHGWDTGLGDTPFTFNMAGAALGFATRGVTVRKKTNTRTFTAFVGASGAMYSAPYFQATSAHNFGSGFGFTDKISDALEFSTMEVIDGSLKTAAQGLSYRLSWLRADGGGGLLENRRYAFGQAAVQPFRVLILAAGHNDLFYQAQRFTVDNAGASVLAGPLSFNANAFAGYSTAGRTSGQTFGASARFGPLDFGANYQRSRYSSEILGRVNERIGQRFHLSQYVTESSGRISASAGGGYVSNKFSVDISYNNYFMPAYVGRSPFQQALTLTLGIRGPHDTALNIGTYLLPDGKVKFTTYADTFTHGPLAGGGVARIEQGKAGKFAIRGVVVDSEGQPVEGAAVRIGKAEAFTDSAGAFSVPAKNQKAQPVAAVLEDFAAGNWEVIASPASAAPDAPTKIVVRRKP
jgi:hypothetical protein